MCVSTDTRAGVLYVIKHFLSEMIEIVQSSPMCVCVCMYVGVRLYAYAYVMCVCEREREWVRVCGYTSEIVDRTNQPNYWCEYFWITGGVNEHD